jgi:nitrate/nitrite-specific signal transduction histidine kinase
MRERVEEQQGELQIESVPGRGTTVRASFPWRGSGDGSRNGDGSA